MIKINIYVPNTLSHEKFIKLKTKKFFKLYNYNVNFFFIGNNLSLLKKINLDKKKIIHLVIGLNNYTIKYYLYKKKYIYFIKNLNNKFIPYEYNYFSYMFNKNYINLLPKTLDELSVIKNKFILNNIFTSNVGKSFNLFLKKNYKNKIKYFLNNFIYIEKKFFNTWKESYMYFNNKNNYIIYTYTTSPLSNIFFTNIINNIIINNKMFIYSNYIAILSTNIEKKMIYFNYIKYILSSNIQTYILKNNFMYNINYF